MLWSDTDTDSEVGKSIEATIESAAKFKGSFDQHVVFVSKRYPSLSTLYRGEMTQTSQKIQIVDWSEIEGMISGKRELLKSYVAAGVKIQPRWFRGLPPLGTDRRELPFRPSKKKLPRDGEPLPSKLFSFNTLARFEHLVKEQYASHTSPTLIAARNHEPRGYAIAAKWFDGADPVPYVDLWLLTKEEEDTAGLSGLSPDKFVNSNGLDYFSLSWIRYVCAEKVKRELAREIHTNYDTNVAGRGFHSYDVRIASLRVRFIFFDTQASCSLDSVFPSKFPTVDLSWDELFPGEHRDDCIVLSDTARSDTLLIVKHWKFLYGLEIEHQYKINLNRISPLLARDIEDRQFYHSSIPHTHEVKIDNVKTFSRLEDRSRNLRNELTGSSHLESKQCVACKSVFLKFANSHEQHCAKCTLP